MVNSEISEQLEQQNDIPQLSVIFPTIFVIMVNDLGNEFQDQEIAYHILRMMLQYGCRELTCHLSTRSFRTK
jgi:hypothetical protein